MHACFSPTISFVGGGKVFPYFYNAFYRLMNAGLQGNVSMLKQQYPDYKLWVRRRRQFLI